MDGFASSLLLRDFSDSLCLTSCCRLVSIFEYSPSQEIKSLSLCLTGSTFEKSVSLIASRGTFCWSVLPRMPFAGCLSSLSITLGQTQRNRPSTARNRQVNVCKTGVSIPNSFALRNGKPKITSISIGLPFRQSVCILLPIPGNALIFSINRSTSPSSRSTPHPFPTAITSRISRLVNAVASAEE